MFRSALAVLLGLAWPAFAQEWKKIEPADSALIVAIPALQGAKPTYFDRAEGADPKTATTDKAGYAASGTLGVFWYEFAAGPSTWRDEGLRAVVEALD